MRGLMLTGGAILGMCLLGGCLTPRPGEPVDSRGPAALTEPVPVMVSPSKSNNNDAVLIRPGLTVSVVVLVGGKKEVEEVGKRVSEKGDISLPLVGSVPMAGLSLNEAALSLQALYGRYFVNPQAIVEFVVESGPDAVSPWGYVTVLGRVKRPGRIAIPATRNLTVSGAIQRAGGFDTSAKDTAIRVTHRTGEGRTDVREVNLRAVGSQGLIEEDIVVGPEDIVYVIERSF
jgi:polysaccharide export outer membrane protein